MQKTNIPQAESKSADLVAQNLEQLKQIFPEVIKEGRVDFEALNDLLGNYGDTAEERFALNWAGKANARREAQKRSTGTLRPCPEESVDWDSTENLYIEGDNLEVLKLIQKSYHSRVKMIYIDPPYNTGKDFVYKDNYADNMKNYLELTGQDKKLSTNTESDGRYHSNWLNMMYPRLKLARNLLTDDGVIFISIDDNEVANLRKICDEIFGEENFIGQFVVNATPNARDYGHIGKMHEYILFYSKSVSQATTNMLKEEDKEFRFNDEIGGFNIHPLYNSNEAFHKSNRPNLYYPFYINPSSVDNNGFYEISLENKEGWIEIFPPLSMKNSIQFVWRWGIEKSSLNLNKEIIAYKTSDNEYRIVQKMRHSEKIIRSILSDKSYTSRRGTAEGENLLGNKIMSFPKPVELIKSLTIVGSDLDSIILDFFSGSATTAHAVMQLNAEDGGNRKYICVQIPEPTPEESEARKAGYATIPEIAKERIRRAGKKIMEEQKAKAQKEGRLFAEEEKKLDTGFKVFKLDSSNINAWNSDPDNLETALNNSLFNIKEDRSEDDLLYEILIKYGIELTQKINRHTIDGKTVYEMGAGSLIVCLADSLSTAVADGIGKLYTEVSPEGVDANCRVVFKEAGFNGSDEVKTNTLLILKQHGITNVATV